MPNGYRAVSEDRVGVRARRIETRSCSGLIRTLHLFSKLRGGEEHRVLIHRRCFKAAVCALGLSWQSCFLFGRPALSETSVVQVVKWMPDRGCSVYLRGPGIFPSAICWVPVCNMLEDRSRRVCLSVCVCARFCKFVVCACVHTCALIMCV